MESKQTKKCLRCGVEKPLDEFSRDRRNTFRDVRISQCRSCIIEKSNIYRTTNRDIVLEREKRIRSQNAAQHRLRVKKWHRENPERTKETLYAWRKDNQERVREIYRKWYKKKVSQTDSASWKLNHNIGRAIRGSLRGAKNGRHWEDLVGYTVNDLTKHLEKQFKPGMGWDNMGQWHIDHRIPKVVFNFETPTDIDFKRCWSLKNLQPLWATDNLKKHDKTDKPFQPALLI